MHPSLHMYAFTHAVLLYLWILTMLSVFQTRMNVKTVLMIVPAEAWPVRTSLARTCASVPLDTLASPAETAAWVRRAAVLIAAHLTCPTDGTNCPLLWFRADVWTRFIWLGQESKIWWLPTRLKKFIIDRLATLTLSLTPMTRYFTWTWAIWLESLDTPSLPNMSKDYAKKSI